MLRKNNKYFGFTLIELMTSIVIIGIISTIFLVNYRSSEEKSKLNMTVKKVSTDIRLAQSYSLALNEFNGSFPSGGWGVHFDVSAPNSYIIFADQDGSKGYDVAEKFRDMLLPNNIKLDSLSIAGSLADIVFLPPAPTTYINGTENSDVKIYFIDKNNNKKTIHLNFLGLITIEEGGTESSWSCNSFCEINGCGDDGCGGSCGGCSSGEVCNSGICESVIAVPGDTCQPSCDGKNCGNDGCGGSCGDCAVGESCCGGVCGNAYQDTVMNTAGLVGYWKMDKDWTDSKGANDAVANGGVSFAGPKYGLASGRFDGDGDYIYISEDSSLSFSGATQQTIELWFNAGSSVASRALLEADGNFLLLFDSSSVLGYYQTDDGGVYHRQWNLTHFFTADKWYYLAVVYDGNDGVNFYVNGNQAITTKIVAHFGWSDVKTGISIGSRFYNNSPAAYFNGLIDEVAIYNKALSASEILDHYNGGIICNNCLGNCSENNCGDDGCGGSCGECLPGQGCFLGHCLTCDQNCFGKVCGDDGCGGSCGTCGLGKSCIAGACSVCTPDCSGKECGDDGCGGSCGVCMREESCTSDNRCIPCDFQIRENACWGIDFCGNFEWFCGEGVKCCINYPFPNEPCPNPNPLVPNTWYLSCRQYYCIAEGGGCGGKKCGSDGCGGSCGTCPTGETCSDGQCVCIPDCTGKECGDDGCGGICGTCDPYINGPTGLNHCYFYFRCCDPVFGPC